MTRRRIVLLLLYGALIAGWLGFARWVAQPIILAAHEGRSLPYLNRSCVARDSHRPIEARLRRLEKLFLAPSAWPPRFTWLIVLFIDRLEPSGRAESRRARGPKSRARGSTALLVWSPWCSSPSRFSRGAIQDYFLYLEMWREDLDRT